MKAALTAGKLTSLDWQGPGVPERARRVFSWRTLVWSLIFPPRRHRIGPTVPGVFLMALAMGIGTAAYNTASNILFITLSLLLACLLLSGLMSWFNFMGVCWRVRPGGPWRAGHETIVGVEVKNTKSWLPTYGLWFQLAAQPRPAAADPAENKGEMRVRDILQAAERGMLRGRLQLRERLEAGGEAALDWVVKPEQRGEARVELTSVGSLFPFGFLKKDIGTGLKHTVLVWPAQVDYQTHGGGAARSGSQGSRTNRAGTGDDLLAVRRYGSGDSHRLIHWKASARLRQLMVRQCAAESQHGYVLQLDTPAAVWSRPEQFELLCRLAGTMAEDLFAADRLRAVRVNAGPWLETRRLRDIEAFLDLLATLRPVQEPAPKGEPTPVRNHNLITFAPDGPRGVAAHVNGSKTASA